jgi:hypothetical protein
MMVAIATISKTFPSSFSWVNKYLDYNLKEIGNVISMLCNGKKDKFFSRIKK